MTKNSKAVDAAIRADRAADWLRENYDGTDYDREREAFPYSFPDNAEKFANVGAMKRQVTASGSHFFDRDTMRMFASRTHGGLIAGRFLVTSERQADETLPYRYTVRYFYRNPGTGQFGHGDIGGFLAFETEEAARDKAKEAARVLFNA